PVPVVVRAQLFRSSRLLVVVALAGVAAGCVRAWTLPFARDRVLVSWRAWLEFLQATVTALALVWPPAVILLPVALVVATLVALINGRLGWPPAVAAGSALLLCVAAWQQIQFVVPGLSRGFSLAAVLVGHGPGRVGWMLVVAAAALWLFARRRWPGWLEALVGAAGVLAAVAVAAGAWPDWQAPSAAEADWWSVQRWARANTPRDALYLTPIQQGGFRILSQRSVVAEWRDGTQLYFSAAFGPAWWERINALQPGMRAAPDGLRLLVRGRSLGEQTDDEVIALAKRYTATHVVLPSDATRRLTALYTNAAWAIHEPVLAPPPPALPADEAKQAAFLRDVVYPNIRQYRQSDVRLQVIGADGRPLYDATYRVVQTNSAFLFGVSLPPFAPAAGEDRSPHDRPLPPVSTAQLARVRGVFNFSVVARSAWWSSLEPRDGQRRYDDLAQYLGWCQTNGLAVEFSFLSGLPPRWWDNKPAAEQDQRFERHAQDVVERFRDQVAFWEVTDRGWLWAATTNVMARLRDQQPGIKLGISDAARFASHRDPTHRQADRERGLADVRRLHEQGTALDFVALHGHEPWGTPADVLTMYEVLDAFAKEGVPIHITEFAAPAAGPRTDDPRAGPWDPRRQADYCRLAYTTFFGHPGVAAVNYAELGPATRLPAAGLLDPEGRPRPVYEVLRDLITREWRTRLQGRLPLDGRVGFRGFHGDYELEVTLKDGRTARTAFRVAPGQENAYRFEFDAAAGRLVAAE
ncbi:endo-1,4-beta-xylanase, partial [bacterium]|nr:endo-1,4-beta-xylanase [bacterium]